MTLYFVAGKIKSASLGGGSSRVIRFVKSQDGEKSAIAQAKEHVQLGHDGQLGTWENPPYVVPISDENLPPDQLLSLIGNTRLPGLERKGMIVITKELYDSLVLSLEETLNQPFDCTCEAYQERDTGAVIHDEDKCWAFMEDHLEITLKKLQQAKNNAGKEIL